MNRDLSPWGITIMGRDCFDLLVLSLHFIRLAVVLLASGTAKWSRRVGIHLSKPWLITATRNRYGTGRLDLSNLCSLCVVIPLWDLRGTNNCDGTGLF